MRVAIVGCGGISEVHIPSLQKTSAKLVAVCDKDKKKADWASKFYTLPREVTYYTIKEEDKDPVKVKDVWPEKKLKSYYDLDEMLRSEKNLDVAFVLTTERDRPEATIKCLEAGLHVFCEKALAERLEDAERMVKTAEKHGRWLGINHNYLFSPPFEKLKEMIDAGELGEQCLINCLTHSCAYYHTVYLMRHFGGEIAWVRANFEAQNLMGGEWAYGDFKSKAALFEYAKGGFGLLGGVNRSFALQHQLLNFTYIGTAAKAEIRDIISDLIVYPEEGGAKVEYRKNFIERKDFAITFEKSVAAFINSILQNKEPPVLGLDGLRVMQIEYAISKSKKTGKAIKPY